MRVELVALQVMRQTRNASKVDRLAAIDRALVWAAYEVLEADTRAERIEWAGQCNQLLGAFIATELTPEAHEIDAPCCGGCV